MFKYWTGNQISRYDREQGQMWDSRIKTPAYYGNIIHGSIVIEQYEMEIIPSTLRTVIYENALFEERIGPVVDALWRTRRNEQEAWKERTNTVALEWIALKPEDIPDSYIDAYRRAMSVI